jgi:hypothetical protein
MISSRMKNRCKKLRANLVKKTIGKLSSTLWLQDHIAACPRCRMRIARVARVDFALTLLKSQPHSSDLLARANISAINVLKHSLRESPKAEKLRQIESADAWRQKCGAHIIPLAKTAACLAVILIIKLGVLSSMDNFCKQGSSAVEHYYARHLGQDYADEIFSA